MFYQPLGVADAVQATQTPPAHTPRAASAPMLCGFSHWRLSYLLSRFNLLVTQVVLYQENVANKTSFLFNATTIPFGGFFFHSAGVNTSKENSKPCQHMPLGRKGGDGEVFKQGTQKSGLQRLAEHLG